MKPTFTRLQEINVVDVHGKAVAVVGGTQRRHPRFELRLWGFDVLGQVVVLERTLTDWVESTQKEINRPCHARIVPIVRRLAFHAGLALGKCCGGGEIRPIKKRSGLFAF